jgi:hypothetical protein
VVGASSVSVGVAAGVQTLKSLWRPSSSELGHADVAPLDVPALGDELAHERRGEDVAAGANLRASPLNPRETRGMSVPPSDRSRFLRYWGKDCGTVDALWRIRVACSQVVAAV